jgi:hypothetical protein
LLIARWNNSMSCWRVSNSGLRRSAAFDAAPSLIVKFKDFHGLLLLFCSVERT